MSASSSTACSSVYRVRRIGARQQAGVSLQSPPQFAQRSMPGIVAMATGTRKRGRRGRFNQ